MASGLRNVSYHVTEGKVDDQLESRAVTAIEPPTAGFADDEAAARYYLERVLRHSTLESNRPAEADAAPGIVPELRLKEVRDESLTHTRTVSFQQSRNAIPIFGSHVIVELGNDRSLVGLTAELAHLEQVEPIPTLSSEQAFDMIIAGAETPIADNSSPQQPELTFFFEETTGTWHLAYLFENVPILPIGYRDEVTDESFHGHGLDPFPRLAEIEINYLVDAHNGRILFFYSANPMFDVPTKCRGIDEEGQPQEFFGRVVAEHFELSDPLNKVCTYDLQLGALLTSPFPVEPVTNTTNDWAESNRAAVSAHVNATRVMDFYRTVLKRNGIDDKGMELVSIVNVTYPSSSSPPHHWRNAVWWKDRMWYGQIPDQQGQLRSFSRFLDVIAHEVTHGVTQYSSNLVYKNESGALNESFSDIIGVIINNWYLHGADSDPGSWNWQLGAGLGLDNLPLRDMSTPSRTGDPAHMKDYYVTSADNGGVHTNSNIFNKAAYNVLIAVDETGQRIFPPREVAILYYLTLIRLSPQATFMTARQMLLDVARTFYAGDAAERARKIKTLQTAYSAVGIG